MGEKPNTNLFSIHARVQRREWSRCFFFRQKFFTQKKKCGEKNEQRRRKISTSKTLAMKMKSVKCKYTQERTGGSGCEEFRDEPSAQRLSGASLRRRKKKTSQVAVVGKEKREESRLEDDEQQQPDKL